MRILSRAIFREILASAALGGLLFTFVLFLQRMDRLFALLVRSTAPPADVAKLLLYSLPATIPFSLPLGVLVGVLIGLSRMSTDGEITAIRAGGVPGSSVARPVLLFAFLAMIATALASLWLTPLCLRKQSEIARRIASAQLTADIEARIFDEQFPNTVLYVGDVLTGKQVHWRPMFMADVTSPEDLQKQKKDQGEGPRITVAGDVIATPDIERNRIQLNMRNVWTIYRDKEGKVIRQGTSGEQVQVLNAQKTSDVQINHAVTELDTGPLYKRVYRSSTVTPLERKEAAIELHQRLALPFACLLLALVGIPLGVSSRKGGKSTAFVLTVFLAFLYYLGLITLIGLAKKGNFPVVVAVWTPNTVFAIVGTILLLRLERPGDKDVVGWFRLKFTGLFNRLRSKHRAIRAGVRLGPISRFGLRPMLIDGYVLNGFLFYFIVLLMSLVVMLEIFTFFELLSDMVKNNIPMEKMLDYLVHLAPKLVYDSTPMAVLVATLICFGVLTKHNEVTAFKAGGVSVYRLAVPVLFAATLISALLFAFDYYWLPEANRRQEALRAEIKGRPVQTYLRPDRQWVSGEGSRIYNYRYLDTHDAIMYKVNVYELDPQTFHVVHLISAERARWEPSIKTWVFQNGLSHEVVNGKEVYQDFSGRSASFAELSEPPSWFIKEEKQYKEMNFKELAAYIQELKASGLDTIRLQVQYNKKFSVPLFAFIMALLSIPFAFIAGTRSAMTGVGISFGIAISYWVLNTIFEQVGDLNQLPAVMAAWSPDALFSIAGLWFMTRMKT